MGIDPSSDSLDYQMSVYLFHTCVHAGMYACVYVCERMCVCVCVCVCVCIHEHAYGRQKVVGAVPPALATLF